eukprot:6269831-Ditylum_brightwellii.AAC.1
MQDAKLALYLCLRSSSLLKSPAGLASTPSCFTNLCGSLHFTFDGVTSLPMVIFMLSGQSCFDTRRAFPPSHSQYRSHQYVLLRESLPPVPYNSVSHVWAMDCIYRTLVKELPVVWIDL